MNEASKYWDRLFSDKINYTVCYLVIPFSPPHLQFGLCSLSIHSLLTYRRLHKNNQREFELPPFWLVAVPIEIWYTQSLTRSIVLQTLSYKRHRLEQDKLLISASKVDTPSNIDSQTFLSRDTETPVATNQPQWHKKLLLQCIYFRGSVSGQKKCKKDSSILQSCDDYPVRGRRSYPNLYSFVIKTVTDCTVFLNMIIFKKLKG